MSVAEEFERLVRDAYGELGRNASANLARAREYAAEKAQQLADIIEEPGYGQALIAARNAVAMELGIGTVRTADAADQRLLGVIQGALGMGARLLSGGAA